MDPDTDRPLAPPTLPGERPAHAGLPWNRKALWSLVCGIGGLVAPLVNIVAIVLGALALRDLNRPDKREQGLACAVTGIVSGILGIFSSVIIAFMLFSMFQGFASVQGFMQTPNLQFIQMQMRTMPEAEHVAELIVERSFPVHMYVVEGGMQGSMPPGRLVLGGFDFSNYDHSPKANQRLDSALASLDMSAPWYRFGQCWFVRFGDGVRSGKPQGGASFAFSTPTASSVVAGWSLRRSGEVRVLFKGREVEPAIDAERWDAIWAEDAVARETESLPAMEPPAFPTLELLEATEETTDSP